MKSRYTFLALALLMQCGALSVQASDDPFNHLIWNRSNALTHNGKVDRGDWFEWWYFKVVVPETQEAFYIVYGVVNPWDVSHTKAPSRSYVGVGSFKDRDIVETRFTTGDFQSSYDATKIKIGENQATDHSLQGKLTDSNGNEVSWDIQIQRKWSFNAMSWTMSIPNLYNIYWYPAQADATATGHVNYKGRRIDFVGASAYQDRNWGRSFPKWWTWLVSNHFKNSPGTTLAAGGGLPKILSKPLLEGLCIGLKHNGKEYAFRPQDASRMKFEIKMGKWEVEAINRHRDRIKISAWAPREKFLLLSFESPQGPTFYDYEALLGKMTVQLSHADEMGRSTTLANLESDEAGIEFGSSDPYDFDKSFQTDIRLY